MYFPMELCSTPHGIGRFKDRSFPLFSIVIVDHCATVILTLHYILNIFTSSRQAHNRRGTALGAIMLRGELRGEAAGGVRFGFSFCAVAVVTRTQPMEQP